MTELSIIEQSGLDLILQLQEAGALDAVSCDLSGRDITWDQYESLLRMIGQVGNGWQWWIGDLINYGEDTFGQEAFQVIEGTRQERYNLAERITGKAPGTLVNYASQCERIKKATRRPELPFSVHEPVAALDHDEQAEWLERTIENSWGRAELRDAIRDAKTPPSDASPAEDQAPTLSIRDRKEAILDLVYAQGQPTSEGGAYVTPEVWAQVVAVCGGEQ